MSKILKRSTKAALQMLLALALVLSLFCVNALAADAPTYAHLEIGTTSAITFNVGDTVKIPVSLKGLGREQYLSGFSCKVTAADDYLTVTDIEFASDIRDWSGGYNPTGSSVNKVNLSFAEHPEESLHNDGLLFNVVCKVAKEIPSGTNTGIKVTKVSMSQTSSIFLNSTDGTQAGVDPSAVVYPVDADGNPTGGVSVPEETTFTMTVSADKVEAVMDEIVTVRVTGNGGTFVGADYRMSYDPTLFELISKPGDAELNTSTNTFRQVKLFSNAPYAADGTVIGTYTFKVLAQDAEVTGSFALVGNCYIESLGSSGSGNAEPCETSAPAEVKITLKDDLTVTADDVKVDYDGTEHGVTATTNKTGATILYWDGTDYTLSESPKYSNVGEYTVKFRAALKGYASAYGEAKVIINQPKYFTETTEYVSGYSMVLVYTNYDTTRYTYDGSTMLDVTAAGYSLNGITYNHVYAWVVRGTADISKIGYTSAASDRIAYSCDVNGSNRVDLRDAVAAVGIYNAESDYMTESNMAMILRADVDHSKAVDSDDYGKVLAELKK